MRKWFELLLKLFWGGYLTLTSLYCLLAFLPYTYFALIKAPAYAWMPWFVRHHSLLYWLTWAAAAVAYRHWKNRAAYFACFGILAGGGLFLSLRPFLEAIESDRKAYWGGLIALWIIVFVVLMCAARGTAAGADNREPSSSHLSYSVGVLLALGIALVSVAGARIRTYADTRTFHVEASDLYLILWSVVSHVLVAILLISVLNLIRVAACRTSRPHVVSLQLVALLLAVSIWVLSVRFLENALSFEGWQAHLYAASLAAALTLLGYSVGQPFFSARSAEPRAERPRNAKVLVTVSGFLVLVALALPTLLGGGDWNGLYQGTFTLTFWGIVGYCVFRLLPRAETYPLKTILAALVLSLLAYKGFQATDIFWAKPLGETDDDIQRSLEKYAARDVSFHMAFGLLGNGRSEPCGDLCRIMREYTEIRGAKALADLKLVDPLVPARGERPNIFLLVIDSMRPDYLGAYNPQAHFTPNMDALANDSVVVRNVWTPYAGTSLSEPAIWAGAMQLHAHFMQPFARANSLEKLVKADGYQMMVSDDEILSQILSPSDELIKLDGDKKLWNELEFCSTVQQAKNALEHRSDAGRPIFFYTQPKNVHQFARNSLPQAKAANWPAQMGFNYRISFEVHQVDECMGGFLGWLKAHALYDNSIIIVTSDHGDATGEFGRNSHSLYIYPEIMRVPLIIHLPKTMQNRFVHDDDRVSALIDITPSLYYLLGHRPVVSNPLFGHPLLMDTPEELHRYHRSDLFLASDVRAAFGILADNGRYFYATYDSPAQSYLYDLANDPHGEHDILTGPLKKHYDEQVIEHLHEIADFYGYKPGIGSLLASSR